MRDRLLVITWSVMTGILVVSLWGVAAGSAQPSPIPGLGIPVPVQRGTVAVTLLAPAFNFGVTVRAKVANGLPQIIYTTDEKSDCSIVFLEAGAGDSWRPVSSCVLGRTPYVYGIGPGRGRPISLNPMGRNWPRSDPSTPGLHRGIYRLKFTYGFSPGPEDPEPFQALSPALSVR